MRCCATGSCCIHNHSVETLLLEESDVHILLKQLALEDYMPLFEAEEIRDMETFLSLKDGDLREMGITEPAPRNQILLASRRINDNQGFVNPRQLASST